VAIHEKAGVHLARHWHYPSKIFLTFFLSSHSSVYHSAFPINMKQRLFQLFHFVFQSANSLYHQQLSPFSPDWIGMPGNLKHGFVSNSQIPTAGSNPATAILI